MRRIVQWHTINKGMVYISFSGGKDSTVLAELVWSIYPDLPAVFSNTTNEYPEIQKFVNKKIKEGKNIVIVKPDISFKKVIERFGWAVISKTQAMAISRYRNGDEDAKEYRMNGRINKDTGKKEKAGTISKKHRYMIDAPFKISENCCEQLKKKPFKKYNKKTGRVPFTGEMASESMNREEEWIKSGCNAFDKKGLKSSPLSFWTEQDILHFLKDYSVDYCSDLYGDIVESTDMFQLDFFKDQQNADLKCTGVSRSGCMFCMFGLELETLANHGENRFTKMKKTHPKHHNAIINKLGAGKVLDFMKLPY